MYADDIVLLSENSLQLHREITVPQKYSVQWEVELNLVEFHTHIKKRVSTTKIVFNTLVRSHNMISLSDKFQLFIAIFRSVACYAAQICGIEQY